MTGNCESLWTLRQPIVTVRIGWAVGRRPRSTRAREAGEDFAMVSRALGHASVAADVYMRVTPAMKDRLAQRMEAALGS